MSIYRRLLHLLKPGLSWIMLTALLGCATIACGVGLLATSTYLISAAALHPEISTLAIPIVGVRFFGVARGVFRYLERLISHRATFRLLAELRGSLYEALEPLLPAYLHNSARNAVTQRSSGDVLQRLVQDIETLQHFYVRVIAPPAVAVLMGGILWWFLGRFGGIYALLFLICLFLAGAGVPGLSYLLSQRLARRLVRLRAILHAALLDGVLGCADLLAFGQEEWYLERIRQQQKELGTVQVFMARISGLQQTLSSGCAFICAWLLLATALPAVHAGRLAGTSLALVVLAALAGFESVQSLPMAFQYLGSSQEAARRLFEIMDTLPGVIDPPGSPLVHDSTLEVRHLSFRYAPHEPEVIHDLTLKIPAGRCLAIIGASGVGKSTLVQLLLRYWEYEQGNILFSGHELRSYRREDLYQHISVVEQHTTLFNTTLGGNLRIANPQATEEELYNALRQAQLHDFVQALPQKLETIIGEQGHTLSAGERQRLAIARAFLKDAPLLILDEPSANIDALNEQSILQALQALRQNRTVLLITHRSSLLEMADMLLEI
ncbi:thiol reductant ABC exporter subunit CydC [Ktedonosporobacter rubrisoli]|nr:thiol reductant ABC exporter subunit CydC [Ktedonosporobacter rubrisoli]